MFLPFMYCLNWIQLIKTRHIDFNAFFLINVIHYRSETLTVCVCFLEIRMPKNLKSNVAVEKPHHTTSKRLHNTSGVPSFYLGSDSSKAGMSSSELSPSCFNGWPCSTSSPDSFKSDSPSTVLSKTLFSLVLPFASWNIEIGSKCEAVRPAVHYKGHWKTLLF